MKLRLLSLFVAGALAGALATTGMQVYADKQAETKLPLMEVRQFTSVFNAVKDYYVDEVSDKELLELAVEGMVSGLDPHSSFLDPEGFEDMSEATHGSFGGLGIEVTKDVSGVRVISPGAEESCRCLCVNLSNMAMPSYFVPLRIAKVNTKTPTTFFSTWRDHAYAGDIFSDFNAEAAETPMCRFTHVFKAFWVKEA